MAIDLELLVTGDEITRGAIIDTNSSWLAQKTARYGVHIHRITAVGDVADDICTAIREASNRCEVLIVSGGLGPTSDDLTAACAADVAGVPLVSDERTFERIQARYTGRPAPLPGVIEKQALVPQGAEVLDNDEGSAPGFRLRIGRAECFFFAGVPKELKHLAQRHLLAFLSARATDVIVTRTLRCVGLPESRLDAALLELARGAGVTFGLRAAYPETWATFTIDAPDETKARAILDPLVTEAARRVGTACYSTTDDSLSEVVGRLCLQAKWTVSVAESCTGGLLGAEITAIAGSSRYFSGGVITYSNEEKTLALGVPVELLLQHGAVSEPVARAMAEGALSRTGTTTALAVTGIAGPDGGTPEKPVGTVWIALASPRGTVAELHRFTRNDRDSIRRASVAAALDLLRRTLLEHLA